MWTRRACLVLEGLPQVGHNNSGRETCLASICLLMSPFRWDDLLHKSQIQLGPIGALTQCSFMKYSSSSRERSAVKPTKSGVIDECYHIINA